MSDPSGVGRKGGRRGWSLAVGRHSTPESRCRSCESHDDAETQDGQDDTGRDGMAYRVVWYPMVCGEELGLRPSADCNTLLVFTLLDPPGSARGAAHLGCVTPRGRGGGRVTPCPSANRGLCHSSRALPRAGSATLGSVCTRLVDTVACAVAWPLPGSRCAPLPPLRRYFLVTRRCVLPLVHCCCAHHDP